jgi:CubicO group peptidase (beta-lactamase class C family)
MRTSYRTRCTATAILLVAAHTALLVAAPNAPAQAPMGGGLEAALDSVFAPWSSATGPGCAVAARHQGEILFQRGYGAANLEHDVPISPGSIFHVASVSKQFTAAAIMLLAREGHLSLDDDIRLHVPEVPDYGHRITIRHLLNHTSGLRDQWDLLFMARGRFEENRITEDDVLEIVSRQRALNFVPGTEYLYSNTGYTLAGTIVRRVTGQSLRAFAEERIFRPLGMDDTHFHDDYTMVVRGRAAGYAPTRDGGWRVSLPNYDTYGATSLFTTVGDLLKWDANLSTPSVGDEELLREMITSAILVDGDSTGYGLGIATDVYRGARVVGHGGADAGYRSYLGRFPAHDLSVVVLCNAASANPTALARSVADLVIGERLEVPRAASAARSASPPVRLEPLAGVYVHPVTGAPVFITLRDGSLVVGRSQGPTLVPLGGNRFQVAGQPVALEFNGGRELVQTVHGWPERRPISLFRRDEARFSPTELQQFAGTYHSEELGASYTVAAADGTLVVKTRWGVERTVRPAYGDTFHGDFLLTFLRGVTGEVEGMLMSSGRVRNVEFTRVGGTS